MLRTNSFSLWKTAKSKTALELKDALSIIGIELEIETGHLFYTEKFKPLAINFELLFIRHGETYGNCGQSTATGEIDYESVKNKIKNHEKRIYQGDIDTEINQLTEYGKQQACEAAEKLNTNFLEKGWKPDVILTSSLKRAYDTALPFIEMYNFQNCSFVHEGIKEISFGSWENCRVCDIQSSDPCHLFYREQHALVKDETKSNAENFCDVLLRAYKILTELNNSYSSKRIVMFSHSMFGAACCILLGKGQKIENGEYLAFDGKRTDGTYYTMPNATPFLLTSDIFRPQNAYQYR